MPVSEENKCNTLVYFKKFTKVREISPIICLPTLISLEKTQSMFDSTNLMAPKIYI